MRADAHENRQAILTAAWKLFSTIGIDVSMRTIASEAGVGIGTLYRHFPAKNDLLIGIFDYGRERLINIIDRHTTGWDDAQQAAETWNSFVHSVAELELGVIVTQVGPTIVENVDFEADLAPRMNELMEQLERVLHRARRWALLREDVDTLHFHLGLAVVARPLTDDARKLVPDYQPWLVETYIRGLKP